MLRLLQPWYANIGKRLVKRPKLYFRDSGLYHSLLSIETESALVDLFWQHEGSNWACEFKFSDAPKITKSMLSAIESLSLKRLWVIYPGNQVYKIHPQIDVLPLQNVPAYWDYGQEP